MSNSPERDADMANGEADEDSGDDQELLLGGLDKLVIVRYWRVHDLGFRCTNSCLQLPGQTSHAASFQIEQEDHTLGNSLRYFINKNPDVEFCGYTIPHPSETKMHIRIQTWGECRS